MKITRSIYPYSLRESISRYLRPKTDKDSAKNVRLSINKSVYLDLDASDSRHNSIIYNGYYNLSLSRTLNNIGKRGGLMVEYASGAGYFSSLWLMANPNNTAFCFEYKNSQQRRLMHNLEKNELGQRAAVVDAILGEFDGTLNNYPAQEAFNLFEDNPDNHETYVPICRLDTFMEDNSELDVDVLLISHAEDAESVINGSLNLLKEKRIHNIIIETQNGAVNKLSIPKTLASFSYLMKACDSGHMHYTLVQPN